MTISGDTVISVSEHNLFKVLDHLDHLKKLPKVRSIAIGGDAWVVFDTPLQITDKEDEELRDLDED